MPLSWPERRAAQDLNARAQGYRDYTARATEAAWFRRHGLPLAEKSVQRAIEEFARFYAPTVGATPGSLPRSDLMRAFRQEAVGRHLDRTWGDEPITTLLEDRGVVDQDDGGWEDFWQRTSPGDED